MPMQINIHVHQPTDGAITAYPDAEAITLELDDDGGHGRLKPGRL
jgi:hypothetical protein